MSMYYHQKAGRDYNIKKANESFGNVAKFKYLGPTVTNLNYMHEEVDRSFRSGNACYQSH